MQLSERFIKYMEEAIGHENALVAFSAFQHQASVSVRVNPFKLSEKPEGTQVPWSRHGCILDQRPVFTLDPLFHGGAYYVQDSSSMFVGHIFRQLISGMTLPKSRPVRVLDLCAAPGGKTTDLAASLREMFGDSFLLVANEVMKARVGVLADNVVLWGDPNVVVTSADPKAFASLQGFFDVIVADVPCSGEGMFRKDEQAQDQWSEDNVALCEARQRRIVADVWPALSQNGLFIYSTCTFNARENDGNVRWISESLDAELLCADSSAVMMEGIIRTGCGYSLVPGHVPGEGQYCSALRKRAEDVVSWAESRSSGKSARRSSDVQAPDSLKDLFKVDVTFRSKGGLLIAVPSMIINEVRMLENCLQVVSAGCAAGMVKGRDFVPDADLALSLILKADAFPSVEVDKETALAYLHRDAILLKDVEKGYIIIKYDGVSLGFVKNIGNRCNNLHPQSRRIRMDIK